MRAALSPLLGPLLNRRPKALAVRPDESAVPYSGAGRGFGLSSYVGGGGTEQQLQTFGTIPAVYACVSELAESTAQVEWHLYRRSASGRPEDREQVTEHLAIDLWDQPNPFMDHTFFVELISMHLDLCGEAFIVIGTTPGLGEVPTTLWPVVPTRISIAKDRRRYLTGYVYTDPDGDKVPFDPDEVIHLKYPNPNDVYRGLSPVSALMPDLDADRFATEWNRNFFLNSAEPGGLIEIADTIGDDEFTMLKRRWDEQHRGTGNAHRVAILTNGMTWKDRSFSMRDLQFTELRKGADERIMLGFRMGKTLLGQTEGVNRATAEAAEYVFGKYRVARRLRRLQRMLNRRILPRYINGDQLMFDFESPVTDDVERDAADRNSRTSAAVALVTAGWHPDDVLTVLDMPAMRWISPAAVPAAPTGSGAVALMGTHHHHHPPALAAAGQPQLTGSHHGARWPVRPRNADDPPAELDPADLPDVTPLQEKFDDVMAALIEAWADAEGAQKQDLVAQVLALAESGSITDLTSLTVDTTATAALLAAAMLEVGDHAADRVVEEAAEQGVTVQPREPNVAEVEDVSGVVAALVGTRLVSSAVGAAIRVNSRTATPQEVAGFVQEQLALLSTDGPRPQLGGALTGTQNEARIETLRRAPEGALYSSEVNDSNTCGPCRAIDGKWLGNISDIDQVSELYPGGAYGGYINCEGRERCRGTITGVWRRARQ